MRKITALLLALCMALGLFAGCGQHSNTPTATAAPTVSAAPAQTETPTAMPEPEPTEAEIEIQKAIALGLVPEGLQGDYAETVTNREFCELLTNVIALRYGEGEYLDVWRENAAIASEWDEPMTRGDGALAIFAAALAVEMVDCHCVDTELPNADVNYGAAYEGSHRWSNLWPVLLKPFSDPDYAFHGAVGDFDGIWAAERYPWRRASGVSHKLLMEYDEEAETMHYGDPFSRSEAVCIALRCYESWVPREYVTTTDPQANAYDRSILTDALLQKQSSLPEVTHDRLPAEWRGMSIYSKGQTWFPDFFHERDIRFLAENGMNFARLYLSFTTLRYPDYPEDGNFVNLSELRELDQMLAWAMEYDVHLSLCMLSPPGYANGEDVYYQSIGPGNWPEPERWELTRAYWVMLANRYADIPSKNLTFELNTEWGAGDPELQAEYAERWGEIAADIREISPGRVLLAGFNGNGGGTLQLAESMAALGVSIAAHPYAPGTLRYNPEERAELGYVQDVAWPMIWFPSIDFNDGRVPLTISGEVGGITLTVYVRDQEIYPTDTGEPILTAYADGAAIGSYQFSTGGRDDRMTVSIPEGTETVTLTHTGYFQIACLSAEGPFGVSQVITNDADGFLTPGDVHLVLATDGSWSDAEGRVYDADAFYEYGLLPFVKLAEQYGVGFMVNEFTFFDRLESQFDPIPLDTYIANFEDSLDVFEEHGIGYVTTFISHGSVGVIGDAREKYSMWSDYPDYLGWQTYTYDNGLSETFPVNNTLLNLLKQHMKP